MMNPQELMLGNLVYRIDRRGEVHLPVEIPLQVLEIGTFESGLLWADNNPAQSAEWLKIQNRDLCGIPINEEWLLKFGFTRHHEDYYNDVIYFKDVVGKSEFQLGIYAKRRLWPGQQPKAEPIRYVHQLQNIYFALTQSQLKIQTNG